MFVTADQIQQGIIKYVSTDMLPKVEGWKKVLFGASIELIGSQRLAQQIMSSPYITYLGIKSENGLVDIDKLKQAIQHQIGDTKVPIEIPVVGTYRFGQADIERIYQIITSVGDYA